MNKNLIKTGLSKLCVAILGLSILNACKKGEVGSETEAFDQVETEKIRKERDDIIVKLNKHYLKQIDEIKEPISNINANNIVNTSKYLVDKYGEIAKSTQDCKDTNEKYKHICTPGEVLQLIATNLETVFKITGAVVQDTVKLVGNGGIAFIQLTDFLLFQNILALDKYITTQTKYRALEVIDIGLAKSMVSLKKSLCNGTIFSKEFCSQSAAREKEFTNMSKRIEALELKLAKASKSSATSCTSYVPNGPNTDVILFKDRDGTEGHGTVGAKTNPIFKNSGDFPSTTTRYHVRVLATASSQHNGLGWINKSQVKCQ